MIAAVSRTERASSPGRCCALGRLHRGVGWFPAFAGHRILLQRRHRGESVVRLGWIIELSKDLRRPGVLAFVTEHHHLHRLFDGADRGVWQDPANILIADFHGKWIVRFLCLLPWTTPVALSAISWLWLLDSIFSPIDWMLRQVGLINGNMYWLGRPTLRCSQSSLSTHGGLSR
jgi:hypothetical protein